MDKLLWLLGSGRFGYDPKVGSSRKVGRLRNRFIGYARDRLPAPA